MNRYLKASVIVMLTLTSSLSWAWRLRESAETAVVKCNVFFRHDNGTVDRFKMKISLADYGEKSYPDRLKALSGNASQALPSNDTKGLWINASSIEKKTLRLSVVQLCKNSEASVMSACSGDDLYQFKMNDQGETIEALQSDIINAGHFGVESCQSTHFSSLNSN